MKILSKMAQKNFFRDQPVRCGRSQVLHRLYFCKKINSDENVKKYSKMIIFCSCILETTESQTLEIPKN